MKCSPVERTDAAALKTDCHTAYALVEQYFGFVGICIEALINTPAVTMSSPNIGDE